MDIEERRELEETIDEILANLTEATVNLGNDRDSLEEFIRWSEGGDV